MATNSYSPPPNDSAATAPPTDGAPGTIAPRPSLFADRSFWGMTVAQFLGAFNDNLFKQLVLLLAVGGVVGGAAAAAGQAHDGQSLATAIFALPFLLFSGFAGYLSERSSKRTVIVVAKAAEIVIMLMALVVFAAWNWGGMNGLLFVLFLMGAQSAFFGPSKYGVLPELFDERDLSQANGVILMTTFLAIIFGTALAGWLKDLLGEQRLWLASLVCVALAVVGTLSSLLVRPLPAAKPDLRFTWSALGVPGDVVRLLRRDRPLSKALLAYCMFWFVGGLVQQSVNALGKLQFRETDTHTSWLAAAMGVGIAGGAALAGQLSRRRVNFTLTRIGAWLIVASLALLSAPGAGRWNLLGYWGTMAALVALGVAAGLFAVPLQVFLQARPPASLKGRTIATMNLSTWIAIMVSAGAYKMIDVALATLGWPKAGGFALIAAIMLPVALFYRPDLQSVGK